MMGIGERRTKSGQLPEVQAYRAKLDSIRENTLPVLEEANRQAEEIRFETKCIGEPLSDSEIVGALIAMGEAIAARYK